MKTRTLTIALALLASTTLSGCFELIPLAIFGTIAGPPPTPAPLIPGEWGEDWGDDWEDDWGEDWGGVELQMDVAGEDVVSSSSLYISSTSERLYADAETVSFGMGYGLCDLEVATGYPTWDEYPSDDTDLIDVRVDNGGVRLVRTDDTFSLYRGGDVTSLTLDDPIDGAIIGNGAAVLHGDCELTLTASGEDFDVAASACDRASVVSDQDGDEVWAAAGDHIVELAGDSLGRIDIAADELDWDPAGTLYALSDGELSALRFGQSGWTAAWTVTVSDELLDFAAFEGGVALLEGHEMGSRITALSDIDGTLRTVVETGTTLNRITGATEASAVAVVANSEAWVLTLGD